MQHFYDHIVFSINFALQNILLQCSSGTSFDKKMIEYTWVQEHPPDNIYIEEKLCTTQLILKINSYFLR